MDIKQRDFQKDFCGPAINRLDADDRKRVALALDAAIAFGVLEYLDGNDSLRDRAQLEAKYWGNVMQLKRL